ncbi:MAG TPA: protoporphyrinogen oxidase [Kofleriaceae bacterium]|jgi:oxygen-dependent protoporphyrinogen oxidase
MRIAIIGAGLGGLTAALALVADGHDVVVREAAAHGGGVIGTSTVDGYVREHASSSFLGGPPRGMAALCAAMGVPVEKASPAAKARWIYLDGKLRALPASPLAFVRSDLLTWRGKLDLLREPLRPARRVGTGEGGDDESMHAFAARRFGAEAARAIIAPFVTGVYAADAHDISLAAGFPRLAALDAAGGIVRGSLRGMLRRKKEPGATPRGMYAPAGGMGAVTDKLVAELGARVRFGSPVRAVEARADGLGVRVDGESFDGAVLATPAQLGASLVAPVSADLAARLREFQRAPMAQVYLGFRADQVARAANGFGALVALGEDVRVLGIVFESTVWAGRAPAGHVLLRCIFGGSRDPGAASLADGALVALAVTDVATVLGATGAPSHASVVRWPHGVAQYRVGHKERVRDASAVARRARIALAGADYRGAGVNDLVADAKLVAAEVASW